MKFRFHPSAAAEHFLRAQRYADEDPVVSARYVATVDTVIGRLREAPLQFPSIAGGVRSARVPGFPVGVVFRIDATAIVIVALAHDIRMPGYWRHRR